MKASSPVAFSERVAERASQVRLVRVVLSVLAFPFYLLGGLVGLVWVALVWCWAAVAVGFDDARKRGDDGGS